LSVLFLRGVSTGDFQEALATLLGKDAPNVSPAVWACDGRVVGRLRRSAAARSVGTAIRVWADGVYLQARMEESAECVLVLIGTTPKGNKELVGF